MDMELHTFFVYLAIHRCRETPRDRDGDWDWDWEWVQEFEFSIYVDCSAFCQAAVATYVIPYCQQLLQMQIEGFNLIII